MWPLSSATASVKAVILVFVVSSSDRFQSVLAMSAPHVSIWTASPGRAVTEAHLRSSTGVVFHTVGTAGHSTHAKKLR